MLQNNITALDFNSNLSAAEPWASYPHDHTDLPRLREGRVGGQVMEMRGLVIDGLCETGRSMCAVIMQP